MIKQLFNEAEKLEHRVLENNIQSITLNDLGLDHIYVIYPGKHIYSIDDTISVWPLTEVHGFRNEIGN